MIKISEREISDGTMGLCLTCHDMVHGVEPDARKYKCESCGAHTVYGLEEALLMGAIEVDENDGDE
jgi:hypothetical protein